MDPGADTRGGALKTLFARRLDSARADAFRTEGTLSRARIEELDSLARLVALERDLERPSRSKPWLVAAALCATLVIISLLLYARVRQTEIELTAAASEVSFTLLAPQPVTQGIEPADLLLTCACDLRVPGSAGGTERVVTPGDGPSAAVRLTAREAGGRRGSISVAAITLPADATVRIRQESVAGRYRLSLEGADAALRVNVFGPVAIAAPGEPLEVVDYRIPRGMPVSSGGHALVLDLQTRTPADLDLSPQIAVKHLAFSRVEEVAGTRADLVRRVSTIASGTLYWEALNGTERPLRRAETIEFDGLRGEIGGVELGDHGIALRFHGNVSDIAVGWGDNRRSLMPTWLEWLRARHGLSLLWGSTIYVFTLLLGALRWLKIAP